MKYKIYEKTLNEVIGSSDVRFLTEIEASSFEEVNKILELQYPRQGPFRIDECKNS